jgi:hypothetical protein
MNYSNKYHAIKQIDDIPAGLLINSIAVLTIEVQLTLCFDSQLVWFKTSVNKYQK